LQLTLIDSTALLRLMLNEPGAEFVANLLTRAEDGLEEVATTIEAVREALEAGLYAVASALTGSSDPCVLYEKLRQTHIRMQAYSKVQPLLDYLARLAAIGRLHVYTVSIQDVNAAFELALREQIPLRDAVTIHLAEKIGANRIASFSRYIREHAPRNVTVVPNL